MHPVPIILSLIIFMAGVREERAIQMLEKKSSIITKAELNNDVDGILAEYDDNVILMPEYQSTMEGKEKARAFYKEVLSRQTIKRLERKIEEFITIGSSIIEVGTFEKSYVDINYKDSVINLTGKYWHIWKLDKKGSATLSGNIYGYFKYIRHPERLILSGEQSQPDETDLLSRRNVPFELKAYNALMEKGVRLRNGDLRSEFFASDARIMPFGEPTVEGVDNIRKYIIGYSQRGTVTLDNVMCYTYDYEISDPYILEYAMFKVRWTNAERSGRTEGKGVRVWKRQKDHSLKLYREIGTHNHIQ